MKKTKALLILFIFCLLVSLIFPTTINEVYANEKNEVTLNFGDGVIHDGYVEYSKIGKLQLFKGDELVANISNNMKIDLNEADYEFIIEEIPAEDTGSVVGSAPVRMIINNMYYSILNSTFKLESSKFSGVLDIKLKRTTTVINTKVEKIYTDITSKGTIDLTNGKEYVIDFSKDDQLTKGLKTFANLKKTLYYKNENNNLIKTENENEAVIKIVGNEQENKAILTAVNVGSKKSENFKGIYTALIGSKLQYESTDVTGSTAIINETRTDYYNNCTYDFTFQYVKEDAKTNDYKVIEGANQIYTIDESKNATFRIDADYSLFENGGKVYVDNILVDSKNYTSKTGSTIITLKDAYLKTLAVGEHTLKVTFSDNGESITKFIIKGQQNTNIEDNKNNENNNLTNNNVQKDNTVANPKTGDNVIVYFILFTIAVLGIVTLKIINTKRKK